MERYQAFFPITAEPFRNSNAYTEVLPCEALLPYVRCFWGTREPVNTEGQIAKLDLHAQGPRSAGAGGFMGSPKPENRGIGIRMSGQGLGNTGMDACRASPVSGFVTPDVCMDIIFTVDDMAQRIENMFCGINDTYFQAQAASTENFSVFAVRFYAWAAAAFAQEGLQGTKNQFYVVGVHFEKLKMNLEPLLWEQGSMQGRVPAAERILLSLLRPSRLDSLLLRAVDKMIESRGNLKILELATDLHISSRQMERIFHKNIGCTPKKMAELIRYQYVWQEACFNPQFQVLDAVHKFGYTDQAHLLHNFQQIHGMALTQARNYATGQRKGHKQTAW